MKTKQELRALAREQRGALSEMQRAEMSTSIANQYMRCFEVEQPKVVHLFLPIPHLLEVNTMLILKQLNTEYSEVKTVTSIIADNQQDLLTVEVRFDDEFTTNSWGIAEPVQRKLCNEKEIDEVLTPLLAVDVKGCRLGYGKGFYDRFFATCSPGVKKTGLNYVMPIEELIPQDAWDVPLSRLIIPEKSINFI